MTEPMILTIASGILATLLGVGFGCLVLEFTVRALRYKLTSQPAKRQFGSSRGSLPWPAGARK
jgi:hypothetical protein